jgi:hypothetical protein
MPKPRFISHTKTKIYTEYQNLDLYRMQWYAIVNLAFGIGYKSWFCYMI